MTIKALLFFFITTFLMTGAIYGQQKVLNKFQVDSIYLKGHEYFKKADFENSLKTLRIALFEAVKINNDTLLAAIYNRIGRNFMELSERKKALQYFDKALFYSKKTANLEIEQTVLINIGNCHVFDIDSPENVGFYYYDKALKLARLNRDSAVTVTINMNKAWSLFDRKKFDAGLPFLTYVNNNFLKYGDKDFSISVSMLNGRYYDFKNQNEKAKFFFEKGVNHSDEIIFREDKHYLYQAYSEFLFKIKDYKNAYYYLKQYDIINTKLYNESKISKANIQGINFEIDEYKREINKIEAEKKTQAKQLKNSKTISYLSSIIAVFSLLLIFLLFRNIKIKAKSNDKLKVSNQQLKEAKEIAEEASKVKSQFVSTITHELRTPLYGVIGMTNILEDEQKELQDNPHLKSLKFSAQYLLSLVNDILKINKLEEEVAKLDSNQINLSEEMTSITNALSFLVKKNNNILTFTVDDAIPKIVNGDKLRLTQILINLIGNALKFTKNGKVIVAISSKEIKNNVHYITFNIKDNGIGIAPDYKEKIFEKFVQVDRKEEDYQGTGLGLAIVKKLLHLFNSEIQLESEIGEGTTFTFTIPFENVSTNPQIVQTKPNQLFEKENYRILIVEDNKINQVVTRKIIEKQSGSCVIANDGYEAIKILKNQTFDIILMDINMPGIDGYETTLRIRETNKTTPIIALTASSKDQIREKALASGMNDIIVKPFEPIVLVETFQRNLKP